MNLILKTLSIIVIVSLITSCDSDPKPQTTQPSTQNSTQKYTIPAFDGQLAYNYVLTQTEFGPRVPNSTSHSKAAEYFEKEFIIHGAKVLTQKFQAQAYTGKNLNCTNIIAQHNPTASKRILIISHWDSRFIADKDNERMDQPIDGADDGASGVGVILALSKLIQQNPINDTDLGIDFLLLDAEDQGKDSNEEEDTSLTWCLGAQHWAKNKIPTGYDPEYGILLDMVGSKNPRFGIEYYSNQYAPKLLQKVWKLAQSMGYSNYFSNDDVGGVIDDHVFINAIGRIPTIDIINKPTGQGSNAQFGAYHHTHDDNIDLISKKSLRIVGQVITAVIYREASATF